MNRETIARLAHLARLELDAAQEERLATELGGILAHMQTLQALDTEGVPPTTHGGVANPPLRADEVQPGLTIDDIMRNAPERLGDGFGVPKIIE